MRGQNLSERLRWGALPVGWSVSASAIHPLSKLLLTHGRRNCIRTMLFVQSAIDSGPSGSWCGCGQAAFCPGDIFGRNRTTDRDGTGLIAERTTEPDRMDAHMEGARMRICMIDDRADKRCAIAEIPCVCENRLLFTGRPRDERQCLTGVARGRNDHHGSRLNCWDIGANNLETPHPMCRAL